MVFKNPMIARGYLNTMFVLVMSLILQITLTSLGAYFLSRRNVMFQKPIMLLITFTMFFSGGMITHLLEYEEPAPDWQPVGLDPAVHDQRVQSDYSENLVCIYSGILD